MNVLGHGTRVTPDLVLQLTEIMIARLAEHENRTLQKLCVKKIAMEYYGKWNLEMTHYNLMLPLPIALRKKVAQELIHKKSVVSWAEGEYGDAKFSTMSNMIVSWLWAHLGFFIVLSSKEQWAHPRILFEGYITTDSDYESE